MGAVDLTYAFAADIVKSERDENGDLLVYGKATGPDLDGDAQICDPTWLKSAMPDWFAFGNIREMHQPVAAGVGIELVEDGQDWYVKSRIVDPGTAAKIEAGVLKGYSIGIASPRVVKDAQARNGRITGGSIVEVSVVDRPCNPTAKMAIAKSADSSTELADAADPELQPVEVEDADELPPAEPEEPIEPSTEVEVPGLDKAVSKIFAKRIVSKSLNAVLPGYAELAKGTVAEDISTAQDALVAIAKLIAAEAEDIVEQDSTAMSQLSCLIDAAQALRYFQCLESMEDDQTVAVVQLDAEPTLTKSEKTDSTNTDEITELRKSLASERSAHEAEIASLRADLEKLAKQPAPGGPVLARPQSSIVKAEGRGSALAEADRLETLAETYQASDPRGAANFRVKAAQIRASLT